MDVTGGPFRVQPALPVQAYRSFSFTRPLSRQFWRPASCAEVDCPHHMHGWATSVLPGSADEAAIRASGRAWSTVEKTADGFMRFVFPAGQACFKASAHKVPVEREPIWHSRNGDWRGNCGGERVHTQSGFWIEEFQEHQQRIVDAQERG